MGQGNFITLAHEAKHMERIQREGKIKFYSKYFFPQILGVLVLLMAVPLFIWSTWVAGLIVALAALPFFLPWPATFRAQLELEAYSLNMAIEYWTTGKVSDYTKERIYQAMVGRFYYRMSWDKEDAMEDILVEQLKITKAPKTYAERSYLNLIVYTICMDELKTN